MKAKKPDFMIYWKDFMDDWDRANIKPKNIVKIKTERENMFAMIGYVHVTSTDHIYTATDFNSGKIIEESHDIHMLGDKVRSHFIPLINVQIEHVYSDPFDWADGLYE